jgi:signal transduction histidine kinase
MSQPRSADAARPGARPAHDGAAAAPAPRNWRLACRLIVLVAIPTLLGLALTGLRVTGAARSAQAYNQVSHLAVLGQQVSGLTQAIENERAGTAAFIEAGRPAAGLPALHRQYVITDGWAATVRRVVSQDGPAAPARARATVLASIAELPALRGDAAQGQTSALAAISGYSMAVASLLPANDGIADASGDSTLIDSVRALGSLARMQDQAAQQQAILAVALAGGRFGPETRTALMTAQAQQASDLASFRSSATREESWALAQTLASPPARQAQAVEQRALAAGTGGLALGTPAGQQWSAGMSLTVGWMRHSGRQLAAWITGDAQAQQRSEMRSAVITGAVALAVLVLILLTTMIIIRSMVRVHREAVRLAGEEAQRRSSVSAISASFFRRSHALLERLLRLIDSLEHTEQDPGRLARLFQIDHLVTRMRRNSDSALVLAGHETSSDWTEPASLVDVLSAAVSEIEQYNRVVLDVQLGDAVRGDAVADVVHLLAELLENATTFSPKTTQVIVSGHLARGGGVLVKIADAGMGVPGDELRQLNVQLAHPPAADGALTRHMGLFAVAHLAARHGITVVLAQPPDGGTTAEVHLPAVLISPDPAPGWRRGPAQARDAVRATAAGGAAAADPLFAAPRFAAGPEPAPGAEHAAPGGALAIFESVESEYPQVREGGRLRGREPQAAPAGTSGEQRGGSAQGARQGQAVAPAEQGVQQRSRDH